MSVQKFACAIILACLGGCERGAETIQAQPPIMDLGTITTNEWHGSVRLAAAVLSELQALETPPLVIPLETIRAVGDIRLVAQNDTLKAETSGKALSLLIPVQTDLRRYDTLELRFSVDQGDTCKLALLGSTHVPTELVDLPIANDGEFHTYSVRTAQFGMHYSEELQGFNLLFPGSSTVTIENLSFRYEPRQYPERRTLDTVRREILPGTQPTWQVTVPHHAVFRTHLGYVPPTVDAGPVQFRVIARTEEGVKSILADETFTESESNVWRTVECSLDDFAGKTVELDLQVAARNFSEAASAFWGQPMVIESDNEPDTVPVILISLDTLRADHLGCYGYERNTSPNLDAFARDAVRFDNAVVYEPWTLSSHITMLTGLHHERHGVNHAQGLAESRVTLTERLRDAGYISGAFVGHGFWLDPARGFQQGFDVYDVPDDIHFVSVTRTVNNATQWLAAQKTGRLFLFFHTYEIHSKSAELGYTLPYEPSDRSYMHFGRHVPPSLYPTDPEAPQATDFLTAANLRELNVTPAQLKNMIDLYDDSIRMVDYQLDRLFELLRSKGLYDKALIVVTSDHGEDFGEHGRFLHGSLHETSVRVPLLIKFPHGRAAGMAIQDLVTNADLMPTVLDALGLAQQPEIDGYSLIAGITGVGPFQQHAQLTHRPRYDALRTHEWKLIHDFRADVYELYDIKSDPFERNNRYHQVPEVLAQLKHDLTAFQQRQPGWHIEFHAGEKHQVATVELYNEHGLECSLRRGESTGYERDTVDLSPDTTLATATIALLPSDVDRLHVLGHRKPIRLQISASDEGTFTVASANGANNIREFEVLLDPADMRWHATPPKQHSAKPTVRIWRVPLPDTSDELPILPEDAIEKIESLGYLSP